MNSAIADKIRIMAFDLDGTLLDEQKRLSERSRATLMRAAERGIWLLISTGRGLVSLPEAVTGLDLFQYAIISNGAHVVDMKTREAVYSRLLTEEMLAPAMKYIEDPDIMREIFCKFEVYADEHCLADLPHYGITRPLSINYIHSTRTPVKDTMEVIKANYGYIENVNLIFADQEKRHRYWEELAQIPTITVCSALPWNLEIGAQNSSKAHALDAFAKMNGLSLENCMTFGDSSNDTEMVKAAGIGVAMGNGTDELKASADFVSLTNEEDGCAYAIEQLLGI